MALRSTIECKSCKQTKSVWHSGGSFPPDNCDECDLATEAAKLQIHLDELAELSVEERLKRIERWIYNHSRNHPQREMRF